jgi:hypothetical protein
LRDFGLAEIACAVGQNTGMMASWVMCVTRRILRHCSEAIQSFSAERFWIASLRSQ